MLIFDSCELKTPRFPTPLHRTLLIRAGAPPVGRTGLSSFLGGQQAPRCTASGCGVGCYTGVAVRALRKSVLKESDERDATIRKFRIVHPEGARQMKSSAEEDACQNDMPILLRLSPGIANLAKASPLKSKKWPLTIFLFRNIVSKE